MLPKGTHLHTWRHGVTVLDDDFLTKRPSYLTERDKFRRTIFLSVTPDFIFYLLLTITRTTRQRAWILLRHPRQDMLRHLRQDMLKEMPNKRSMQSSRLLATRTHRYIFVTPPLTIHLTLHPA